MPPHQNFPGVRDIDVDQLCSLPYAEQGIWFLNGFWEMNERCGIDANEVWAHYKHFVRLDLQTTSPKGDAGNELDAFWAAKFLEENDQTLTSISRKQAMKEIDADNNGKMALIEYLTYKYQKDIDDVVSASQGQDTSQIQAAQKIINQALEMLPEIEEKLVAQKDALRQQKTALHETQTAKVAANEALKSQAEAEAELEKVLQRVEKAKVELEQAVEDFRREEQAVAKLKAELEAKATSETGSAVSRGKAQAMLSALVNEDPLPLRKAKLTQEAALRRVEREQKRAAEKAAEAKEKTKQCKLKVQELQKKEQELTKKKAVLDKAIQTLESSYVEMSNRMAQAQEVVDELKGSTGSALGAVWWMERSLYEADEALPQAKQKYNHKTGFQFTPPAAVAASPSARPATSTRSSRGGSMKAHASPVIAAKPKRTASCKLTPGSTPPTAKPLKTPPLVSTKPKSPEVKPKLWGDVLSPARKPKTTAVAAGSEYSPLRKSTGAATTVGSPSGTTAKARPPSVSASKPKPPSAVTSKPKPPAVMAGKPAIAGSKPPISLAKPQLGPKPTVTRAKPKLGSKPTLAMKPTTPTKPGVRGGVTKPPVTPKKATPTKATPKSATPPSTVGVGQSPARPVSALSTPGKKPPPVITPKKTHKQETVATPKPDTVATPKPDTVATPTKQKVVASQAPKMTPKKPTSTPQNKTVPRAVDETAGNGQDSMVEFDSEHLSYDERALLRKARRQQQRSGADAGGNSNTDFNAIATDGDTTSTDVGGKARARNGDSASKPDTAATTAPAPPSRVQEKQTKNLFGNADESDEEDLFGAPQRQAPGSVKTRASPGRGRSSLFADDADESTLDVHPDTAPEPKASPTANRSRLKSGNLFGDSDGEEAITETSSTTSAKSPPKAKVVAKAPPKASAKKASKMTSSLFDDNDDSSDDTADHTPENETAVATPLSSKPKPKAQPKAKPSSLFDLGDDSDEDLFS